ncbi:hypothetical protein N0V88_006849 [Collariella sp. IMI 366227]|nr:hypothetical protein N0V88_006849 [Collariella sp. IMI 366227]
MTAARTPDISESSRERETFKYDALALSTARLYGPQPAPPLLSSSLSAAPDPGLTAFAQLGLYKLNASRSLVSLFDRHYQHIVAEAIRPPVPGQPPLDSFNALAFERATSVCEHVVTSNARGHTIPGTESGLTAADIPVSIINHLDADARFCQIQDPGRQFYAGVPIRSPAGINIGVYCVFDDTPRPEGLHEDQVHFIRELSVIIMDYLAYKRSHEWYHREQRMLRGLGSFVEGEAALPIPEGTAERCTSSSGQRARGGGALSAEQTSHAEANSGQPECTNDGIAFPARPPRPPSTKVPPNIADGSRSGIDRVFSRAANLIRESLEVEGAMFLNAQIRSYGGLVGNMSSHMLAPNNAEARPSSVESGSSDESAQGPAFHSPDTKPAVSRVLGFSTTHISSVAGDTVPAELSACQERFLHRLLHRYPKGRIFNFEADGISSDHSSSSGGDDSALGSSTAPSTVHQPSPTDHGSGSPPVRTRTRPSAAERVARMFPSARSVALVPLWDPQTGRVFAGGFLWTRSPTRIFSRENELSYLRVFGLAIMAEVARERLRAADKAKTDILGSISHELRTPLHGLVGTIEMLRNTALDGFQKSVLWTLDTSARTLLDIVDHLLDFIKISNLRPSSKSKRRADAAGQLLRSRPIASSHLPVLEPAAVVPLDLFVEEVLESVLAGSSYQAMSKTHLHFPRPSRPASFAAIPPSSAALDQTPAGGVFSNHGQVMIYVDIDYLADWSFRVHPGALRRIVMNLFGNSLKFTHTGFIRVSLRQDRRTKRKTEAGLTSVTLTVSDSGKGIGEDYVRDQLFIPFSQEDEFAPGTGLGLSLVHRMVSAVGGSIDVVSKVGQGTTTTVVLPLPHLADDGSGGGEQQEETDFQRDVQTLAGRRIRLRHFETETRIRPGFFSDEDLKQSSQFQLMKRMCEGVLHMTVLSGEEDSEPPPDFIVSQANDLATSLGKTGTKRLTEACPHVFVCQDLASAHLIMSSKDDVSRRGYEVVPEPHLER